MQSYFVIEDIQRPEFMKAHIFQSIVLAVIGLRHGGSFNEQANVTQRELSERLAENPVDIETLVSALRDPEAYMQIFDFVQACSQKTNVETSKTIRFLYFREALRSVL